MSEIDLSRIEKLIYIVRGQKVMMDADLAELYGVETKVLNQAVRRNLERFPEDFMFQPTISELASLRSQIVTLGHLTYQNHILKYSPYLFTENGVAMLSGILNSPRAIQVNISIMRIFTKLRSFLLMEKSLNEKVNQLEHGTNQLFKTVFERMDSIEEMVTPTLTPKRKKIGINHE
jgi:hypothetical protein